MSARTARTGADRTAAAGSKSFPGRLGPSGAMRRSFRCSAHSSVTTSGANSSPGGFAAVSHPVDDGLVEVLSGGVTASSRRVTIAAQTHGSAA